LHQFISVSIGLGLKIGWESLLRILKINRLKSCWYQV
jgi:hypothetical protein